MSAPSFLQPPGAPSTAASIEDIRELADWILDSARARPVVVLTAMNDRQAPYFEPEMVQLLVADDGDVVVVQQYREHALTRELQRRLPPGLNVFNGAARIYWPVSIVGKQPGRHPLVRAESDDTPDAAKRARLTGRWRQGPKALPPAQRPVAAATVATPDVGEAPPADELHLQVVGAYLRLLPDVDDRALLPLRPHHIGPELAAQLAALEPAREPVAEVAARILSGHVWTQAAPVPRRVLRAGAPVVRAEDRAVAWRYPLSGSDHELEYWQPTVGPIVLARIAEAAVEVDPDLAGPAADDEASAAAPAPASARRSFSIPDAELRAVLLAAPGPLGVSEIRAALKIPDEVSPHVLRRVLADALARSIITRTGEKRGTRYSAR